MLILTRRPGERIVIAKDIVIALLKLGPGHRVRIGIEAPPDVPIVREEVRNREQRATVCAVGLEV